MTSIKGRKKRSPPRPNGERERERERPDYISCNSRDSNLRPIYTFIGSVAPTISLGSHSQVPGSEPNTTQRADETDHAAVLKVLQARLENKFRPFPVYFGNRTDRPTTVNPFVAPITSPGPAWPSPRRASRSVHSAPLYSLALASFVTAE